MEIRVAVMDLESYLACCFQQALWLSDVMYLRMPQRCSTHQLQMLVFVLAVHTTLQPSAKSLWRRNVVVFLASQIAPFSGHPPPL